MKITAEKISINDEGPGIQVYFGASKEGVENSEYLLLQRHFEEDGAPYYYVECHDLDLAGHNTLKISCF